MGTREVRQYCVLDAASSELLKMAMTKLGLSAHAYDRRQKLLNIIDSGLMPALTSQAHYKSTTPMQAYGGM